ncbi:MAG TPA: Rne/Rng family ribonuclease [Firmicutes bacterium]|nr:Rne/Rng family ribonuclease [Bacillota bacterium]
MSKKEILVNVEAAETRAAVIEDGILVDFQVERVGHQRYVGNIYKGRVENVLPGMEAAFVDIGLEKNAFLYVGDATAVIDDKEIGEDEIPREKVRTIRDILRPGQEILVQIVKEPIGTKGPRVVTHFTLPGKYVVLMPTLDYVGVSRRIESDEERARLRALAYSLKPRRMGLIVRTAAEGREEKDLAQEIGFLTRLWRRIQARNRRTRAPYLLHRDYDLIYRIVRDLFSEDTEAFIIDDETEYEKAVDLLKMLSPHLVSRVKLYDRPQPLFEFYNIEGEIEKALRRKVWLDCGGYLIFDQTEAFLSIDVNTGRYTGTSNLADTVLKTNLEAATEIAHQLRLRNAGGIILIDFIDMESDEDRRRVIERLQEALKKDKTKASVLGFTQLGLVEMTRKKTRESLSDTLERHCPYCDGRGRVLSEETVALKAEREIKRIAATTDKPAMLVVVHPMVASLLIGTGGANLARIEQETGKSIYVKGSLEAHIEDVEIAFLGTREEVEARAIPVRPGDVIDVEIEEPHASNPRDGITRLEGYIVDVEGGGGLVGSTARVQITKVFRTYARARLVGDMEGPEPPISVS